MKLKIVPPRTGIQWVKSGVLTFFRQPLALSGLFFMFVAVMSVVSLLPVLGAVLGLCLIPGATLGLMAASREALNGRFPMPTVLATAFRAGSAQAGAMLVLGALYAVAILAVMGLSALFDGGRMASLMLLGGPVTAELLQAPGVATAVWVMTALYLPVSLMFWHAPALVHWHGLSPVKSLFFSAVACWRNLGAFTLYGLCWMAVMMSVALVVGMVALLLGSPEFGQMGMLPAMLLVMAMFFTSFYFTFQDCFNDGPPDGNAPPPGEPT